MQFKKRRNLIILLSIAVLSVGVRVLMGYKMHESALLYIGIPFAASLLLVLIRDPNENVSWKKRFLNRLIDAFIIMLGSSILLFEGFVCVVMFMPIYLFIIMIMFLYEAFDQHQKKQGGKTLSLHILPFLILASSLEGASPALSFNRYEQVTVSRNVALSIDKIKQNLVKPIHLQKQRPWFLRLFPMPYQVKAGSITPGAVHEIKYQYYRWFFTNLHEGRMLLEMTDVSENRIKTTFLEDTSYIANYLQLKGTEIKLDKINNNHTQVTLTINFHRTLDPYWYFAPIERYGVAKTADFMITEIMERDTS